jgi:hypothetical protein
MPNPLGGFIFLGGAYLLTSAARIYWPWLGRRNFFVALALVFASEVFTSVFLVALLGGKR